MPLPYHQNKKHIYAWRTKNPERTREIAVKQMRKRRMFENECKRLLNINFEKL
jgi:hypothetical protein